MFTQRDDYTEAERAAAIDSLELMLTAEHVRVKLLESLIQQPTEWYRRLEAARAPKTISTLISSLTT